MVASTPHTRRKTHIQKLHRDNEPRDRKTEGKRKRGSRRIGRIRQRPRWRENKTRVNPSFLLQLIPATFVTNFLQTGKVFRPANKNADATFSTVRQRCKEYRKPRAKASEMIWSDGREGSWSGRRLKHIKAHSTNERGDKKWVVHPIHTHRARRLFTAQEVALLPLCVRRFES